MAFLILIFCTYSSFGQRNPQKTKSDSSTAKFSLTISTSNHATMLFSGSTTYKLTDKFIIITQTPYNGKKEKVIFETGIPDSLNISSSINNINIRSLEDSYFNNCILITSGNEYFVEFKNNIFRKRISIHHYYLKELDEIIKLINSNIPEEFKLRYLSNSTRQNCTW